MLTLKELLGFTAPMHVVDIGAAVIGQVPPYRALLEKGIARLTAVDGDLRQEEAIREACGASARVLPKMIADGKEHVLHIAHPTSGMTSLLRPDARQLSFFNGFEVFGAVEREVPVSTERLADVTDLQNIDFLVMDVQGAELMILENAGSALDRCVAIHTEASFVPLYHDQPTFADIDRWMRAHGFLPHCFADVKPWVIAPFVREGDVRNPFNQLLECDVVYVRGLVDLSGLDEEQLRCLALIAVHCYGSLDLCLHAIRELESRSGHSGILHQAVELLRNG